MVPSPARPIYDGFQTHPSVDFEIEHVPMSSPAKPPRPLMRRGMSDYSNESMLQTSVARIVAAKARPFSVSGRIPVDPANLTLVFRI